MNPLRFGVGSFFVGGLCYEPFAFWGYIFFFWEVFVLSPLHFGAASFFIEGLCFKPFAFWGCIFFHRRSLF
jgi:hypothetical protein